MMLENLPDQNNALHKPVLAFDCALNGCVGALVHRGVTCAQFSQRMEREQAAKLIPLLQDLVQRSGLSDFSDLGMIVTTVGPGSFTGLRIGMASAKAMAAALKIPLVGIGTFDLVARSVPFTNQEDSEPLYVVLETRRKDYYVARYQKGARTEGCLDIDGLLAMIDAESGPVWLCGDAGDRIAAECAGAGRTFKTLFKDVNDLFLPDPAVLARLGIERYKEGGVFEIIEPVYMREADVSFTNKKRRVLSDPTLLQ